MLGSPAFVDGGSLPDIYNDAYSEVSPPLWWGESPKGAHTIVIIADRPEAPGAPVYHWLAYNIPTRFTGIPENALVPETEHPYAPKFGLNSWAAEHWTGTAAAPQSGRLRFRVFAIKGYLNFDEAPDAAAIFMAIDGRVVDYTEVYANCD
ncbi:MAG: YbhB/YbcL family Raf kinase inhibitor-like protein [Puniceicoccales bacterium]